MDNILLFLLCRVNDIRKEINKEIAMSTELYDEHYWNSKLYESKLEEVKYLISQIGKNL